MVSNGYIVLWRRVKETFRTYWTLAVMNKHFFIMTRKFLQMRWLSILLYLGVLQCGSLSEWTEDNTGNRKCKEKISYYSLKRTGELVFWLTDKLAQCLLCFISSLFMIDLLTKFKTKLHIRAFEIQAILVNLHNISLKTNNDKLCISIF